MSKRQVAVTRREIRDAFCKYLQPWRDQYLPTSPFVIVKKDGDIGVPLPEFCSGFKHFNIENDLLPAEAVRTLELFSGATYAHAIALLLWAYDQPIELTPEEEGEQEAAMLVMSELAEASNAANPDLPQLRVRYSKSQRIKH